MRAAVVNLTAILLYENPSVAGESLIKPVEGVRSKEGIRCPPNATDEIVESARCRRWPIFLRM
jgi:hypothetical protein